MLKKKNVFLWVSVLLQNCCWISRPSSWALQQGSHIKFYHNTEYGTYKIVKQIPGPGNNLGTHYVEKPVLWPWIKFSFRMKENRNIKWFYHKVYFPHQMYVIICTGNKGLEHSSAKDVTNSIENWKQNWCRFLNSQKSNKWPLKKLFIN